MQHCWICRFGCLLIYVYSRFAAICMVDNSFEKDDNIQYCIARFTDATVVDPYQTSREWVLTLKINMVFLIMCKTIQNKKFKEGERWFWAYSLRCVASLESFIMCREVPISPRLSYVPQNDDSLNMFNWNVLRVSWRCNWNIFYQKIEKRLFYF